MKSLKLIFPLFLLMSCGNYFEQKDGSPTSSDFQLQLGRSIAFEEVREKVLRPAGCIQCHGKYNDYETVVNELGSIENQVLNDLMPPATVEPLSPEQKGIILTWISNGAPLLGDVVQAPIEEDKKPIEEEPKEDDKDGEVEIIGFEAVKERIFQPYGCITCHANYEDYNAVISNIDKIRDVVTTNRMPPRGDVSDVDKEFLFAWIDAGAVEGEVKTIPIEEEGLVPTYESINRNIIGKKCVACHSPQGQVPFLDLSTRLAIFQQRNYLLNFDMPESSYLIEVITDPFEPMPPPESSFEAVTEEEVKVLTEWIRLGMP